MLSMKVSPHVPALTVDKSGCARNSGIERLLTGESRFFVDTNPDVDQPFKSSVLGTPSSM